MLVMEKISAIRMLEGYTEELYMDCGNSDIVDGRGILVAHTRDVATHAKYMEAVREYIRSRDLWDGRLRVVL